jgi:eukaryotic-like serine/threonine-protein kinase
VSQVAFERRSTGGNRINRHIWVLDLARAAAAPLTLSTSDEYGPIWSPDGSKIGYGRNRDGVSSIYQKSSNGSGDEELLLKSSTSVLPTSWSSDGETIVFRNLLAKNEIWYLPLSPPRKPVALLESRDFTHIQSQLSPDGRWLAYTSPESGRFEVYVQSFPKSSGKWQVSTEGGDWPRWSRDGHEIYFLSPAAKMMAASVKAGTSFEMGTPKALFDANVLFGTGVREGLKHQYDVASDGRFLINTPVGGDANSSITVLLNWAAGLKK